jgi:hypothetical protein
LGAAREKRLLGAALRRTKERQLLTGVTDFILKGRASVGLGWMRIR